MSKAGRKLADPELTYSHEGIGLSGSISDRADPLVLFRAWRQVADREEPGDASAACLATATAVGLPSARMVLVKAIDDEGIVFYTHRDSRKGRELRDNPRAALCVHWSRLSRQVRIEGPVIPVDGRVADRYFASRPRGSQVGAWASDQSSPLPGGLTELDRKVSEVEERFASKDIPRPPFWQGYRVVPERFEFWEHRDDRLHERVVFLREDGAWRSERLYP